MWGRDISRNMVSTATGLPADFEIGGFVGDTDEIDLAQTRNVRWIAKLGSQAYGNPTVAGGRVFVGTNIGFRALPDAGAHGHLAVSRELERNVGQHLRRQRQRHLAARGEEIGHRGLRGLPTAIPSSPVLSEGLGGEFLGQARARSRVRSAESFHTKPYGG